MTVYVVAGARGYRSYEPGETFEAALPADAEARALNRGAIRIVDRSVPSLQPGSYMPPRGWPRSNEEE